MQEVGREQVAAALERVYGRAEFTERQLPGILQWLADTWNGFKAWVGSLILSIGELEYSAPFFFWLIIAWLSAALVLTLAHLVYTMGATIRGRERGGAAEADAQLAARVDERDAAAWEARARDAAAAGRLREAALTLYHAVVLRLDERGAVRFRPGKTPGDYRGEARRAGDVGGRFDAFVRILLPVAFGPRAPEPRHWESLRAAAAEMGAHA